MEAVALASHSHGASRVSQVDLVGRGDSGAESTREWRAGVLGAQQTFCTNSEKQDSGVDFRVSELWIGVCPGLVNYATPLHNFLLCKV